MSEPSHLHWQILADDGQRPHTGSRYDEAPLNQVTVDVMGYENEAEALVAARSMVERKNYALAKVWECNTCRHQEEVRKFLEQFTPKDGQ